MIFRGVHQFWPSVTRRWVGGKWGREGSGKTPQVKTRGHQLPPDGPDHSTRLNYIPFCLKVEFQAGLLFIYLFIYLFIISRALQGHSTDVQYNLTQNIFTVTT